MSPDQLRGPDDVIVDVVQDLRAYDALTQLLAAPEAVYPGHPKRPQDWPVGVVVTPVYAGSTHLGAGVERTYRVQVTVLATWAWIDAQAWPHRDLQRIQARVADRLDRAAAMPNHRPAGADAGTTLDTEDGERLALTADWRIEHTEAFQDESPS